MGDDWSFVNSALQLRVAALAILALSCLGAFGVPFMMFRILSELNAFVLLIGMLAAAVAVLGIGLTVSSRLRRAAQSAGGAPGVVIDRLIFTGLLAPPTAFVFWTWMLFGAEKPGPLLRLLMPVLNILFLPPIWLAAVVAGTWWISRWIVRDPQWPQNPSSRAYRSRW